MEYNGYKDNYFVNVKLLYYMGGVRVKKCAFLLAIVIILLSVIGCTEKNINNETQTVSQEQKPEIIEAPEKEELAVLRNYEKALKLLDSQLKNGIDKRLNKQEEIGVIQIQKVSDRYYLGSYYSYPRLPLTNLYYSMIDLDEETIKPIEELKHDDYIEEVYVDAENMNVRFVYNGINIMNGFRQYPYDLVYEIETGEYKKENDYTKIDSYSKTAVGNGINIMGLKSIDEKDKEIIFSFKEVEGTILAGGAFCPKITIGRVLGSKGYISAEDLVKLYIDFENTVLDKESKDQIIALQNIKYITNVEIREYLDAYEGNHVVVYLTLDGIDEYKGETNINEETGLDDFKLILR